MGLVNLEKAFDQTPRLIIWWALGRLGFENWLLCPTQSMYENARSRVLQPEWIFSLKVRVYLGSSLSPLLFITLLEALCQELFFPGKICIEMTWSSTLDCWRNCKDKPILWKSSLEEKGLGVNMDKTKVLISGTWLDMLQRSDKDHCAMSFSGVAIYFMFCDGCSNWVHKSYVSSTAAHFPLPQIRILQILRQECHIYCKKTWAPILSDLHYLQRNDQAMVRWMRDVTTKGSQDL